MITLLTDGNKKTMVCPFCGETIQWNTTEEQDVLGNKTIICSECGKNILVPKTELQPVYGSTSKLEYTQNIYSDTENNSSGSSSDLISLYLVYKEDYDSTVTYDVYTEYDPQTGTYTKATIEDVVDVNQIHPIIFCQVSDPGRSVASGWIWSQLHILGLEIISQTRVDINYMKEESYNRFIDDAVDYIECGVVQIEEFDGNIQAYISSDHSYFLKQDMLQGIK